MTFFRQKGQITIPTIIATVVIMIALTAFLPAISTAVRGGNWTTSSAITFLEGEGYWVLAAGSQYATGRSSTLVVAASNASQTSIDQADYRANGTADEVTIQAAIDALPANGGTVYLTEGSFSLSDVITLPVIAESSQEGFRLSGAGEGATILNLSAPGGIKYDSATDTNHITLSDFTIRGYYSSYPSIYFRNVHHSSISNVTIRGTGASITPIQGDGLYMEESYKNTIINLRSILNARWGVYLGSGPPHREVIAAHFYGCTIEWNGTSGEGGGVNIWRGTNNVFVGNVIEGHQTAGASIGLQIENFGQGNIISGNYFELQDVDILINTGDEHPAPSANNVIENNYSNGGDAWDRFIHLVDAEHTIIRNNLQWNHTVSAVTIDAGVTNTKMMDNKFEHSIVDSGTDTISDEKHVDILMDVLAVSATAIRSNEDLSAGIPLTFTIDAQPDVPRTLSGHFDTHAQITAYTIAIVGIDAKGVAVTETLTEADGWDWETSNAFATITSITMSARTGTGAGDTMDIGVTDVLGLSNVVRATGDVYKIKKNNANAVVAGAQVNTTYNTYDMAVIGLAATDDFTIWYKSNLNIVG